MSRQHAAGAKALAPLEKPAFDGSPPGRLQEQFFPDSLTRELESIAVPSLSPADARAFIQACQGITQLVLHGVPADRPNYAQRRAQLTRVADAARTLRIEMRKLGLDAIGGIEAHEKHSMSGSESAPIQWPDFAQRAVQEEWPREGLLSCSWDMVQALEDTARHVAAEVPAVNHGPEVHLAQGLVRLIIQRYRMQFGDLPPATTSEAGWFAAFMKRIGDHLGLDMGPTPVRKMIAAERGDTGSA